MVTANQESKKKARRFYTKKEDKKKYNFSGQIKKILEAIGAFEEQNPTITPEIKKYFSFDIIGTPSETYPKLYKIFKKAAKRKGIPIINPDQMVRENDLKNILEGSKRYLAELAPEILKEKSIKRDRKLSTCDACDLRKQCIAPVHPSFGKYNILVIGEAPGKQEDEKSTGFIGRSGETIWKAMKNFDRSFFHVTNAVKCYPKETRTPTVDQIKTCSKWIKKEIRRTKTKFVLAFGNTNVKLFTKNQSGITDLSGTCEWNEEFGIFIFWCIHPAAALHDPKNKPLFEKSIKEFCSYVDLLISSKEKKPIQSIQEERKNQDDYKDIPF
jgi:DNA polymerase